MLGQCLSQNEQIGQELGLGFSRVRGSSLPRLEGLKPAGEVGEEKDDLPFTTLGVERSGSLFCKVPEGKALV